jgi:glyoxylase-like metal-dependent hydrolase (beta-lactamase superfamily II)
MTWKITTLNLGWVELSRRRMIANANGDGLVRVPVQSWLLSQGAQHVVIDTGFRGPEVFAGLGDGARGVREPEHQLENQLLMHGVKPADVSYVLHTHLHLDHAGQTDIFPSSTVAVVNRKELEYSVSGLSGPSYPAADIKHFIDRLHTPNALMLLDLELTGTETIFPGVRCAPANGHTEGSMLIFVDSTEGLACFCGDVVYSVFHQIEAMNPFTRDPKVSANTVLSRRTEKAALKNILKAAPRFKLFPSHDDPVWIAEGVIEAGQLGSSGHSSAFQTGCWCRLLESPAAGLFTGAKP